MAAGVLRPVRGGWNALERLEGRPIGRRGRIAALIGSVLVLPVAAYAGFLAWLAADFVVNDPGSGNLWEVLWDGVFGLPPATVAAGLLATLALLAWMAATGRVPRRLRQGVILVAALTGIWLLCVGVLAAAIGVETALGDY